MCHNEGSDEFRKALRLNGLPDLPRESLRVCNVVQANEAGSKGYGCPCSEVVQECSRVMPAGRTVAVRIQGPAAPLRVLSAKQHRIRELCSENAVCLIRLSRRTLSGAGYLMPNQ